MALDSTAREANARDSFKKHMIDSIKTSEGIEVSFDKGLNVPKIQGIEVDRWVSVNFGSMALGNITTYIAMIYCCTRKDPEGYRLVQLRDKVVGYLTESGASNKKITLYKSNDSPWTELGKMIVFVDPESNQMEADDGTKFKIVPIRLVWGAKV